MAITLINEETNEAVLLEESEIGQAFEKPVSIIEYAETELSTLAQKPFDVVDSLVLSQLCYMNLGTEVAGLSQDAEAVSIQSLYKAELFDTYTSATLIPEKNRELIKVLCASPRYRDIKVNWFMESTDIEKEQQFCAMTFFLPTGEIYIAFRGTDTTINGWKEDFNMFFLDIIPGQIQAADYLSSVAARTDNPVYVGGHSKGGNLAMYAASFVSKDIQERIITVFNHDGPGLTKGAMAKAEYSDITEKINITLPRSSVVGLIFCNGNYTVIKSDRIGIMQHDPFTWEVQNGKFIYYREVKQGANKLIDSVYELMDTLSGEDRQLFVDTVFEIIEVAGASTFSEFPVKAIHSRDKIVQAMKNLEPETSDKIKMVISELIKIVARKSFRIPENEITTRINEGLAKWGETTSQFTEKVSATKGKIADKVNDTTDRITERVNLTTEKLTEKVTEATGIIAETKDRITDRLNETTGRLTDTIEKARNLLKREEDGKDAPDTETTDKTDEA